MDVLQRLRHLVAQKLGVGEEELAEDIRLRDLPWDSLDILEVLVAVEQEFSLTINEARFRRAATIGEAAELITVALRQ